MSLLLLLESDEEKSADGEKTSYGSRKTKEEPPIVTPHELQIGAKTLRYDVTAGMMPLKNEEGEIEANIFFMAYTLHTSEGAAKRPLMFSFNGGPGSASVWLHLGALGPKRVKMLDDGGLPPPPYQLVDNPHTWLEETDLVFIDPVGTGYSRPVKPEEGKKYWSVNGDIESIAEFIRLYLTRHQRWTSPLFLVGESYGTTRAAGLAGNLIEKGIALNGIVLVSSVLEFHTLHFDRGNDMPFVLFLPTYTATAWYHKKLPADLLERPLRQVLDEAEAFAEGEYLSGLAKGDRLPDAERQALIGKIARYTGLDERFVERSNLRVEQDRFGKELLRDQKRTVGRLDSRFKGIDALPAGEGTDYDPSMTAIRPPYTALLNSYVRGDLGYKTDAPYHILGGGIKSPWEWDTGGQGYTETGAALRSAFVKNPYMKVYVASGYYDMATPYFATEYTLSHIGLEPELRSQVRTGEYEAGHMMYIETGSLAKLKQEVAAFLEEALP